MKQKITVADYAQRITEALPQGVLLNTNGDKHNAMVIGWGGLGTCWSVPTFTVYVRENRYTKSQLDKTGVFTVSIPLDKADPVITKICGWQSGHNIDKVKEAGLTLEEPLANGVSDIKRKQKQVMSFRSDESLQFLCDCLGMLNSLRNKKSNLYQEVADIFNRSLPALT